MKHLICIALIFTLMPALAAQDKTLKEKKIVAKVNDKERLYRNITMERVWKAAVQAASENFTVAHSDKESGILEFHTGISLTSNGFRVGVTISKTNEDEIRVKLNPQKKKQLFAWGAGGRIADKFFKAFEEKLKESLGG